MDVGRWRKSPRACYAGARLRRLGRLTRGESNGDDIGRKDDDDASLFVPVLPVARLHVSFYASRTRKLTIRASFLFDRPNHQRRHRPVQGAHHQAPHGQGSQGAFGA